MRYFTYLTLIGFFEISHDIKNENEVYAIWFNVSSYNFILIM